MDVSDEMARDVRLAGPDDAIRPVARAMADGDAGALPLADADRLAGMITDRAVALSAVAPRGVAQGIDAGACEVMTPDVQYR